MTKIARGIKRKVYKKDGYACVYCGVTVIPDYELSNKEEYPNRATIDHVIPGISSFNNYVTACLSCNSAKGKHTPQEAELLPEYGRFYNKRKPVLIEISLQEMIGLLNRKQAEKVKKYVNWLLKEKPVLVRKQLPASTEPVDLVALRKEIKKLEL